MDNLACFMLNKINQSQKVKHCMIPLLCGAQSSQIHRQKVEGCFPGLGRRGDGESVFDGTELQPGR